MTTKQALYGAAGVALVAMITGIVPQKVGMWIAIGAIIGAQFVSDPANT